MTSRSSIPRSSIQRTGVVLALIVFAACLFYIGKGHVLFLDTNGITIDGKEFRSYASVTVSVDGKELDSPMGRAERAMVTVSGPRHKIVIADDAGAGNKVEKTFTIPTFTGRVLVSIPALLGGAPAEHWIAPFTPRPAERAPAEKMQRYQDPGRE
ncbi:MAG: hypothetical protein LBS00_04595 [Synergistaceae bacterium]|jgi:hypothetical protein|nr:hypothetical protein [Synergistaceae bacterium]